MKSIDKHSLRKVDCEIYWMLSKYIVLTWLACVAGGIVVVEWDLAAEPL